MPSESTLSGPTSGSIQVSGLAPGPWVPGCGHLGALCLRPLSRTLWPTGPPANSGGFPALGVPATWELGTAGGWRVEVTTHSWWCHSSRLTLGGSLIGASPQLYPKQGLRAAQAELPTTTSSLLPGPPFLLSAPSALKSLALLLCPSRPLPRPSGMATEPTRSIGSPGSWLTARISGHPLDLLRQDCVCYRLTSLLLSVWVPPSVHPRGETTLCHLSAPP